ncbi:hypothetical protein CRYUN_Cryun06bG0154100 [Craigia yunnanensis]
MALRSSVQIRSNPIQSQNGVAPSRNNRKKKKHKKKKHKKKKEASTEFSIIPEDPFAKQRESSGSSVVVEPNSENYGIRDNGNVNMISYVGGGSFVVMEDTVCQNVCGFGELRQRNINGVVGGGGEEMATVAARADEGRLEVSSSKEQLPPVPPQPVANVADKLETAESLDWKRLMAEDPNYLYTVEKSPVKYFLEEMYNGNSLRSTTTVGSEKERERVYDTIFHLLWRCEVLIDVGFFVCFDSFMSLLNIMPTRILITLWRLLSPDYKVSYYSMLNTHIHTFDTYDLLGTHACMMMQMQFKRPCAAELCDFGCFAVLASGVILLEQTDISPIYHMICGQGTIKLYVVCTLQCVGDENEPLNLRTFTCFRITLDDLLICI